PGISRTPGAENLTQTVDVHGGGGTFTVKVGATLATFVFTAGESADTFRDSLIAAIRSVVSPPLGANGAQVTFKDVLVDQVNVAGAREGIDYYNVESLNIDLGSGDNVVNIRGTTAVTNIYGHDGNERFYVSSLANENLVSALTADFLEGNLDFIRGNLNISA